MAKIRYRRIPENALLDLEDNDLKILDWSLAALKDAQSSGKIVLSSWENETMNRLHNLVLMMKMGEDSVEESDSDGDR